ncbi:hypothetical protein ACFQ4K_11345 [Tistrella bauzanensis]
MTIQTPVPGITPPSDEARAAPDAAFAAAIRIANIPTLLMVLVQLTGDPSWLNAPYRPRRGRGSTTTTMAAWPTTSRPASATRRSRRFWPGAMAGQWRCRHHPTTCWCGC